MGRPSLVILPSPLIMAATYPKVATRLARSFNVVVPELPDTGSAFTGKTWDEKSYSAWLAGWMEGRQITSAFILGHSNSGAIAAEFAASFPEKTSALILADTIGVRAHGLLRT